MTEQQPRSEQRVIDNLVEAKLKQHSEALVAETYYIMDRKDIQDHPDYQAIVSIGVEALPYVLDESRNSPFPGFMIMEDITGENPVPQHQMGDKVAMLSRWKTRLQELYPHLNLQRANT